MSDTLITTSFPPLMTFSISLVILKNCMHLGFYLGFISTVLLLGRGNGSSQEGGLSPSVMV